MKDSAIWAMKHKGKNIHINRARTKDKKNAREKDRNMQRELKKLE